MSDLELHNNATRERYNNQLADRKLGALQAENARLREALGEAHKSFAVLHGPISKLSDKDPYWTNAGKCIRKDIDAIKQALGDTTNG